MSQQFGWFSFPIEWGFPWNKNPARTNPNDFPDLCALIQTRDPAWTAGANLCMLVEGINHVNGKTERMLECRRRRCSLGNYWTILFLPLAILLAPYGCDKPYCIKMLSCS
jgi:hypothetical protein